MQISRISLNDPGYPDMLRHIKKPPAQLYVMGNLPTSPMVAIVGTRRCTPYGEAVTYQLASELAKAGAIIVSGLAYGIDSIAHRAALDAGAVTIAVLGHGLDHIYPSDHRPLAKEILATGGALVTEYALGEEIFKSQFAERNRIIAGLSRVVIVTESGAQGGAMITARNALREGGSVMAVPGNITSEMSAGPNNLIYKGATPIRSFTDVVSELGFLAHESVPVPAKSADEANLLGLIKKGVSASDDLIEQSNLNASEFANIITLMEITGKVRNLGSGTWVVR